jgi:hypothetical protein
LIRLAIQSEAGRLKTPFATGLLPNVFRPALV